MAEPHYRAKSINQQHAAVTARRQQSMACQIELKTASQVDHGAD